ncbi:hypothetical protein ES288_A03G144600v1, partial [Gossypium darwinii]
MNTMIRISDYTEKNIEKKDEAKREKYKREEKMRIEIAEAWDSLLLAQVISGSVLITQSILRKYIILPSLIIVKNIARMLLFQFPEWSEDLTDWNREMYVKCTYNGVQLSETEFPKNWLTNGIQIKILFPFCLKPWHRFKLQPSHKDPMKKKKVWGMETELPFGSPRKRHSEPYELGETKKDSIISNKMIHKSSLQIQSMVWTNYSLTEKKIKKGRKIMIGIADPKLWNLD